MTNSDKTKQLHQLFSENKFDEVLQHLDDNIEMISYALGMTFNGKDQFSNFMMGFKNAFPDMAIHHNRIFESGNIVAVEFIAEGTQTGVLSGPGGDIPASGKKMKQRACEILEFENGKVKTIHNYQDSLSLLKQIGAV